MAKQIGPIKITGTIGDLNFYQLNGVYYVRSVGRISKRRLRNDPCFAGFRRAQQRFKTASLLVKSVYYTIPAAQRFNGLYGKLVAQALPMVKQAASSEEILKIILEPFRKERTTMIAQPKLREGSIESVVSGPRSGGAGSGVARRAAGPFVFSPESGDSGQHEKCTSRLLLDKNIRNMSVKTLDQGICGSAQSGRWKRKNRFVFRAAYVGRANTNNCLGPELRDSGRHEKGSILLPTKSLTPARLIHVLPHDRATIFYARGHLHSR